MLQLHHVILLYARLEPPAYLSACLPACLNWASSPGQPYLHIHYRRRNYESRLRGKDGANQLRVLVKRGRAAVVVGGHRRPLERVDGAL